MRTSLLAIIGSVLLIAVIGCGGSATDLGNLVTGAYVTSVAPASDFTSSGECTIAIIPEADGEPVDGNGLSLKARAILPDALSSFLVEGGKADDPLAGMNPCVYGDDLEVERIEVSAPQPLASPWAIDIHVDSSGSMSNNDPNRLRVQAGKEFVGLVSQIWPSSAFAVTDFGAGQTTGFSQSRLLTDYTTDVSQVQAAMDLVKQDGGTPLFESTLEVLQYMDLVVDAGLYERALLVLSDGEPSGFSNDPSPVYKFSQDNNIPVNTVALTKGAHNKTMRDLADHTGGIYSSATTASDLVEAFQEIALGQYLGYVKYQIKFPNGQIPTSPIPVCFTFTDWVPGNTWISVVDPADAY